MHRPVIAAFALTLAVSAARADETVWYRIAASTGAPIGYASETVSDQGRTVTSRQHVEVYAPATDNTEDPIFSIRGEVSIDTETVRRADETGRTVAIEVTRSQHGNGLHIQVRIEGDSATVTRHDVTGTTVATVALPPHTRFDAGDALLAGWNPKLIKTASFDDFDAASGQVDRVTIETVPGPTADDGTFVALRRREHDGAIVSLARLTVGPGGRILESRQPMFGNAIEVKLSTREEATARHDSYSLIPASARKSPFRIPDSALKSHIRYHFRFQDGIAFEIPETADQTVTQDDDGATVDICADCGPGLPTDPGYLAAARKPTVWLQSDAAPIRDIADRFHDLDDDTKMRRFVRVTALRLPGVDFVGHFSALAALQRRSGDCSESAALLAALGRAAGIPTKVVNGLVYSRPDYHGVSNVFMPHSWVLAYVGGRWKSYDAALGEFDSTHIALSINDGDDRSAYAALQLGGVIQFDSIAEVRARPSP